MIRLPERLIDLGTAQRYCASDTASVWRHDNHVLIHLYSNDESRDWDGTGETQLSTIIPIRADLAAGDHRALYLAWLLAAQSELDDDEMEPSVPPNLASLSGPLHTLAAFLRIDEDLLAVAAQASDPRASDLSTAGLDEWVTSLPVPEKDALLLRVIHGDSHVHSELRQRFRTQQHGTPISGTRTVKELLAAASARRTHRQQEAEHRAAAERARREREAAIAREKRLDALAAQEEQAWHKVSMLIETKKPSNYDEAVTLLVDLKTVGERAGAPEGFHERYQQLRLDHRGKPSLMQRLDRAGL